MTTYYPLLRLLLIPLLFTQTFAILAEAKGLGICYLEQLII